LAAKIDASVTSLAEISDHLPTADVVVSSTASQLPILRKGSVEQALRQRRYEPMLMVDIAVPRDIDAEVDDLEDVYLYTIDDLKDVVDENIKARQQQACIAESMIDAHVENFLDRLRARDAVDLIRSYRSKMEQLRDVEVAYSLNRLNQGDDAAHVLQMLGRNLINKIIHTPTVQLKKSSVAGRLESLSLMKQLFDLEH
jgi:glutamyl-tRNA reductase